MYNDQQTELEQGIPEQITQHLANAQNNQHTSTLQTSYQHRSSKINIQDESDYIDRWYDGLIGISDD